MGSLVGTSQRLKGSLVESKYVKVLNDPKLILDKTHLESILNHSEPSEVPYLSHKTVKKGDLFLDNMV